MRNNTASIILGAFIAISLVFSPVSVLFQTPNTAHAQAGGNPVFDPINAVANIISKVEEGYQTAKELGLDEAAKLAALKVLKGLVADTINWANQGFQGEPLFIQNEQNFLARIENEQIVNLVEGFQSFESEGQEGEVPYWREVAQSIVGSKTQQFSNEIRSTFEEDTGVSVDTFQNNFNSGGWDGFLAYTQKENNNPLDFHQTVNREIENRIENAESTFQSEFQSGDGFISMRECKQYKQGADEPDKEIDNYSFSSFGASFSSTSNKNCEQWEKTTPGSVIADQIFQSVGATTEQAGEADEVSDILTNSLFVLFDHLTQKGLAKLTSSSNQTNTNQTGLNLRAEVEDILGPQGGGNQNTSGSNQNNEWVDNPDLLINLGEELDTSIELLDQELVYLKRINNRMNEIPKKAKLLDQCILGPDLGWKDRIRELYRKRSEKLERNASKDNNSADRAANYLLTQKDFIPAKIAAIDLAMINPRLSLNDPDGGDTITWLDTVEATQNLTSERQRFRDRRIEKRRLRSYLLNVEKKYIALSEGLTFLENELSDLQDQLATARGELAALEAEYDQLNSQYEGQEQQVAQMQQTITQQKQDIGLKEDTAAEAFQQAQPTLQPQTQSPTQSGGTSTTQNQTTQNQSLSPQAAQSLSNNLDAQISEEKTTVSVQESQLEHIETQLEIDKSNHAELQNLLEEIEEKEEEIDSIRAEISAQEDAIEDELLRQQEQDQNPNLTAADIRAEEREDINAMIQRYRSLQPQISKQQDVDEMAAEAGKLEEAVNQYVDDIESCQKARDHLIDDPEMQIEWQFKRDEDPVEVNLGALMILFDEDKKLFCNGPRQLFWRDDNSGWDKNIQWFQIFEPLDENGSFNSCVDWPKEDKDGDGEKEAIYQDRDDVGGGDGYYECDGSETDATDGLLLPQDESFAEGFYNELQEVENVGDFVSTNWDALNSICVFGCGDREDIFGAHARFWKKETKDFPKDMSCTDWYEASTSDYLGEGSNL